MFLWKFRFLFAPDDVAAGAAPAQQTAQTQAPPSPAPAAPSAGQAAAAAQTTPSLGTGVAAGAAAGQSGSQAQQALSVVQALSQMGVDLGVNDDHAALSRLAQAYQFAQQNHHLVQYGQQYVQHADKFNAWLQQQAQQQQAAQQQTQQWWKAPEWDPSWEQKIMRDANGNLVVAHGQDPSIINKFMAWRDHQVNVMNRFAQNPLEVIRPGLEQLIDQRAQALLQQHQAAQQEVYSAKTFVDQNAQWLYQHNEQGQRLYDQRTGQPALSPAGQRFGAYVKQAEAQGFNTQAQLQWAMGMTQRDVMHAQLAAIQQQAAGAGQQTPPVSPADASKQAFLQGAAGNAAAGRQAQLQQGAQTNGQAPPINTQQSLQQAMMAAFNAAGIMPHQNLF